jgi:peptidoglycan/LPS O-acetylase OafA/YrhL
VFQKVSDTQTTRPVSATRPSHRYLVLDGLRGVAALAVMVMHKGRWFYAPGGFVGHAWMAVDFFFLLSGFVIASAYEARLQGGLPVLDFLRARFIRLYPLIALGMLLGLIYPLGRIVGDDDAAPSLAALAACLGRGLLLLPSLTSDPVGSGLFPLNGPTWSLFFELVANLAYVLMARRLSTPLLATIVIVCGLLVATLPFRAGLDAGAQASGFWWGLARTGFGFFAGVLLFRLRGLWQSRVPRAPVWLLAGPLIAIFATPLGKPWTPAFELVVVLLAFPLLLMVAAQTPASGRLGAACTLSGELSYPIYALHYPLLVAIGAAVTGFLAPPWLGVVTYAVVLVVCWAGWRAYDIPVRAWLTRVSRPRRDAATASV